MVLRLYGCGVLGVKVSRVVIFTGPMWVIVVDVDCGARFVYPVGLS